MQCILPPPPPHPHPKKTQPQPARIAPNDIITCQYHPLALVQAVGCLPQI